MNRVALCLQPHGVVTEPKETRIQQKFAPCLLTSVVRQSSVQGAANYNDDQFSILDTARSPFHLSLLEASYIKVRRPNLCKQREFVYTLNCSSRI